MSKNLKDIILPDLGEGIDGAEVSEISVSTGDTVSYTHLTLPTILRV